VFCNILCCKYSAIYCAAGVFTSRQERNSRERIETKPWDECNRKEQNKTIQEREQKWR
jgi:hypothetical protein